MNDSFYYNKSFKDLKELNFLFSKELIDNLNKLINVLDAQKIPYTLSKSGRKALFCRDPDGNAIEVIEKV